MTVTSTPRRAPYTGDGSTDTFVYGWRILDDSDIDVYVSDVLVTNYTVTGVGDNNGGTIVFSSPPASLAPIVIVGSMVLEQPTNLADGGPGLVEGTELGLDRNLMLIQEIDEKMDRALTVAVTSALVGLTMDDPVAGQILTALSATELGWVDKADLDLSLSEQNILAGYTTAALPAVGTGGRFARLTDSVRGLVVALTTGWWKENESRGIPPEWFGAMGDGVTDDSAAINSAIAARRTLVFAPAKTYKVASGVTVNAVDVALIGQPGAKLDCSGASIGIDITAGARARIQGLTIQGNSTVGSVGIQAASLNCRIYDNTLNDFTTAVLVSSSGAIVRNNIISAGTIFGTPGTDQTGIIIFNTVNAVVDGNQITMPTYSSGTVFPVGINVANTAASIQYNRVVNNMILNGFDGIHCRGPYHVVANNVTAGAFEAGIIMDGDSGNGTTTSKSVVSGNIVRSCGRWGIIVMLDSGAIAINGNAVDNCATASNAGGGITFDSGALDSFGRGSIAGNVITGGKNGIYCINNTGASRLKLVSVMGNTCDSQTVACIDVVRASNVSIMGNSCYNSPVGISVAAANSTGIVIQGNNVLTCTTPLTVIAGASDVRVGDNVGVVKVKAVVTTYTISLADSMVTGDATGGAFNITLPSAASGANRDFIIKRLNAGTNNVTVQRAGSDTIDGATSYGLTAQYQYVVLRSDGTTWHVVGKN